MKDMPYYEAVAQVIPVLFLAIAVGESRIKVRRSLSPRAAVLGALFISAVMVAGEGAALHVLKTGRSNSHLETLTILSVATGVGLVAHYLGRVIYRDITGEESEDAPRSISLILDLGMVAIVVMTVLLIGT